MGSEMCIRDRTNSIIETIVDYNRNKHYHSNQCNHRHFIQDVAKALGVRKLPAIGLSLKRQLEKSRRQCGRQLSRIEFASHAQLDEYVRDLGDKELGELSVYDLEYLVGKFFLFHVVSWEQSQSPDQWSCQEHGCQLAKVEEQLQRIALSKQSVCVLL